MNACRYHQLINGAADPQCRKCREAPARAQQGPVFHLHPPDMAALIPGDRCDDCPPLEPSMRVRVDRIDRRTGTITISEDKPAA